MRARSNGLAAALDPLAIFASSTRGGRTTVESFWAKFNKDGPIPAHRPDLGPCHEWTGYINHDGYGFVSWCGKDVAVHRLACALTHGPLPAGVLVMHACDHRPCGNPEHVSPGTHATNNADMYAKGRHAPLPPTPGESNVNAKLTDALVAEYRAAWAGGETIKSIAIRTGLAVGTIHPMVHGRTWKHVPLVTREALVRHATDARQVVSGWDAIETAALAMGESASALLATEELPS